jgi:hypothetical protein
VAWIIRIVPKIGPFKTLAFREPTPEVQKMFMASFNATIDAYKKLLVPNRNLDVGDLTREGRYQGADNAYGTLLAKLADRHFSGVPSDLRSNILAYYASASEPAHAKSSKSAKKEKEQWDKLMDELAELKSSVSAQLVPPLSPTGQ